MRFLDKALGAFGLQRAIEHRQPRARAIVGPGHSYAGAARNRTFNAWNFGDLGPNSALMGDLEELRARSRQFYRDHPWAKSAIDTLTNQIVGNGRRPRFSAKSSLDKKTREKVLDYWERWSDQCDSTRTTDFYGLQELAVKTMFRDGEVFCRFRRRRPSDSLLIPMQLQLIEADQLPLVTPAGADPRKVVAGIEIDAIGGPVAYWFLKTHPRDQVIFSLQASDTTRVSIDDCAHLFIPSRPGQRRGEPALHPVIEMLHQLSVYQTAELHRKGLAASFGGFVKKQIGDTGDARTFVGADLDTVDEENGTVENAIEPGTVSIGDPGDEFTQHKADDVPQMYGEFFSVHGHMVAAALDLTYEQVSKDTSKASFSSARVGLNDVRRGQAAKGQRIDSRLNQPTWNQFIRWGFQVGLFTGDYSDPEVRRQYEMVEFRPNALEYADPLKDGLLDKLCEEQGWVSNSHNIREYEGDPDEVREEIAADKKERERLNIAPPPEAAKPQGRPPGQVPSSGKANGRSLVQ